ncbi:hypothetical protein [Acetohalobium arabaticum]|uniref:Uncharacterized protein n=1 Tax=Acetohalobium arabaticum (strain ATCC 49924 / DSM 5501 / Z-7288) TaxID=574087 RepID=D9QSB5_ACEAZ|nr:hypothetical protein [Acetohalobium arabaticum]ADL11571.1 hypothetical protein Acear_0019 [Acetohalobium arabaticum DSM 5501]
MSNEQSLEDVKTLINQFENFLSDNNREVMNKIVNELDSADGKSEIDQTKMKELISQLINQNNIDPSQL